ncbi:S24 family peptidase [Deinococcus radiophilus]|uniref:S24 family peptidase n=1 Tax=Deinococcus radiophilus TaxID=32062 RepID=A0A3S0KEY5_9DEIO|nr:S24 family peptidase [Deinococcus radiophilus]RTR29034.1 S24 family peptidase [Deinococcus radiophilus]
MPIPLGFRRHGMFVVQADGDSMTLPDGSGITHGSLVLVHGRDVLTERGHCYAFRLDDGTLVLKRLNLYQGRPALHSDNPAYGPLLLDAGIRNLGRVYAYNVAGRGWVSSGYRGL